MMYPSLLSRMALVAVTSAALAGPLGAAPRLSPQQELDKALAGRVAGKPVDCIDPRSTTTTRIINGTAILYGSGRTIYVQRPSGAESLREDDVLVTELRGNGRLCSVDTIKLHDRLGGWYRGFVGVNPFVPYTRVERSGK